jgi:hypothetical protein
VRAPVAFYDLPVQVPSDEPADQGNFMEELLTTVILVCFNIVLAANGAFTLKLKLPTYYKVEQRNNITEVRRLPYHLHSMEIE